MANAFLRKFTALLICLVAASCASTSNTRDLAWVDGIPISEEDFKGALKVTHRTEAKQPGESVDFKQYVEKLIDERLITQEAFRMELEKDPWVIEKMKDYKLREAVTKLYREEVKEKVTLSDNEILKFYQEQMEKIRIRQITLAQKSEAEDVLKQLKSGSDMIDLVRKYSTDNYKVKGGERGPVGRTQIEEPLRDIVFSLKEGETSPILKFSGHYLIIKVEEKKAAPQKSLEQIKAMTEKFMRKKKEDELGRLVLKKYKDQIPVQIDTKLLSSLQLSHETAADKKWESDERALVSIQDNVLTVHEFYSMAKDTLEYAPPEYDREKLKEKITREWADRKIVDIFALKKEYDKQPEFNRMLKSYEEFLVRKLFVQKVIYPQIKNSDDLVKVYFEKNRGKYRKPDRFRIRQITLRDKAKAQSVLDQIQGGADFSWIAKKESTDNFADKGGERGWINKTQLSPGLYQAVLKLKLKETSEIINEGNLYYIVELTEKSEPEYEGYENIKDIVMQDYVKESYDTIWADYAGRLRKGSDIKINEEAISRLKNQFLPVQSGPDGQNK